MIKHETFHEIPRNLLERGLRMHRVFLFLISLFIFQAAVYAENPLFEEGNEKLAEEIPANWRVPDHFHSTLYPIFSNVPDLFDQKIKIKETKIGTTLNMRPTLWSLIFKKKSRRTYVLRINNNENFDGVLFDQVPFESQVGLLAHELMHVKDYLSRDFFGVAERGWQYLSRRGRIKFEGEIDQMVIDSGLSQFLFEWANYVLNDSDASDSYKDYKRAVYMTPVEIIEAMENMGLLDDDGVVEAL